MKAYKAAANVTLINIVSLGQQDSISMLCNAYGVFVRSLGCSIAYPEGGGG